MPDGFAHLPDQKLLIYSPQRSKIVAAGWQRFTNKGMKYRKTEYIAFKKAQKPTFKILRRRWAHRNV
jgi:hypothetical protein